MKAKLEIEMPKTCAECQLEVTKICRGLETDDVRETG